MTNPKLRRRIEKIVKKKIPLNKPIEELLNDEIEELLSLFHSFCKEIVGEKLPRAKKMEELKGKEITAFSDGFDSGYNTAKDEQIKRLEGSVNET